MLLSRLCITRRMIERSDHRRTDSDRAKATG
jgi:hypothetical protein